MFIVSCFYILLLCQTVIALSKDFSVTTLMFLVFIMINLSLCVMCRFINRLQSRIILMQFSLIFILLLFEMVVRNFPFLYPKIFVGELPIKLEKAVVHSRYKLNMTRYVGTGFLHHRRPFYKHFQYPDLIYDENGFRNPYLELSHEIILLGDSMIEAAACKKDLGWHFRKEGITCQNLAIGSSTIPHYLEAFRLFARSNENTKVLLFIFEGNDFDDIVTFFKRKHESKIFPDSFYRYNESSICKSRFWATYSTNLLGNLIYNGNKFDRTLGLKQHETHFEYSVFAAGKIREYNYVMWPPKFRSAPPAYIGEFGVEYVLPGSFFDDYIVSILDKNRAEHPAKRLYVFYIPCRFVVYAHFKQCGTPPSGNNIEDSLRRNKQWVNFIDEKLSSKTNVYFCDTTSVFVDALREGDYIFTDDDDVHLNDKGTYVLYKFVKSKLLSMGDLGK